MWKSHDKSTRHLSFLTQPTDGRTDIGRIIISEALRLICSIRRPADLIIKFKIVMMNGLRITTVTSASTSLPQA